LKFADDFEERFIKQESQEDRSIVQTLTIGWELLSSLPKADLKKIDEKYIKKYLKEPVNKKE
jgi:V/A-type H+-transporting ATPase subunit B